jgi:hypothetical protein
MARTAHKDYNFADGVKLIIGPVVVGGYGADGGVEYEFASDIYEDESGADGQVSVSQLHDYRMYANITLMETSSSYRDLFNLLTAQRAQLRKINLPFVHTDLLNGDSVKVGTCIFMGWPTPSKSRTAGERVFRVLLPDGAKKFQGGTLNVTP